MPRIACEWFLVTRAFGTSGPYFHKEDALRDASQWSRYALYRRWVIRGPARLIDFKGDWSEDAQAAPAPEKGLEVLEELVQRPTCLCPAVS